MSDLGSNDLPLVQATASNNSLRAQRQFLAETAINLGALVVAAGAGTVSWSRDGTNVSAIVAAVAFVVAVLTRWHLVADRPERVWYEGRAAAESAKTLAWRYAVGGQPFEVDPADPDAADGYLLARLDEILTDLPGLHLVPPSEGGTQITSGMRTLRHAALAERKEAYAIGRIGAQRDWYSRKARWNRDRARRWGIGLLVIEILGGVAAVFSAAGLVEVDVFGFAGALAAAGTSWLLAKQHETLAKAYAVTAQELAAIASRIDHPTDEASWAFFVDEAEEAISREHTLWRASRVEFRPAHRPGKLTRIGRN